MAGQTRRTRALRIGIPALVVAGLTLVALWRLGAARPPSSATTATAPRPPLASVSQLRERSAIGQRAALENIRIAAVPSIRTLWVGSGDERVFAVLDPDVKRSHETRLVEGAPVTLIGLVRAAPAADVAARQWQIDADTASAVSESGTYLYVTEVRPGF